MASRRAAQSRVHCPNLSIIGAFEGKGSLFNKENQPERDVLSLSKSTPENELIEKKDSGVDREKKRRLARRDQR